MSAQALELTVRRGESAELPIRVETGALAYAAITAMDKPAPLRVTATAHGIPDGWRGRIMGAGGMTTLNVPWNEIDAAANDPGSATADAPQTDKGPAQ